MIKRDQFGRDLRKKIDGHISSDKIRELYQLFIENDFTLDNFINVFADAQNLPISKKPAKKYEFKKPTKEQIEKHLEWKKRSAEKAAKNLSTKPKKAIVQMNLERLKKESDYVKTKMTIMETHDGGCDGCRTFEKRRMFSHRVARTRNFDLIAEADNLDLMCLDCSELVESYLWDEIPIKETGRSITAYMKIHDPEKYQSYLNKKEKRA